MRNARVMMAAVLAAMMGNVALAETYIVDQKHPQAADTNPGTEALPWKTVGQAAKTLKAGDTARIKAGRYREDCIQFAHGGEGFNTGAMLVDRPLQSTDAKFVALEAYGDGETVLDGSVELPAEGWTLAEGRKNVYVSKVEPRYWPGAQKSGQIIWVYLNDRLLPPNLVKEVGPDGKPRKRLGIPGDGDTLTFHHDMERNLLYIHLGGKTPAEAGRIEAATTQMAVNGGEYDKSFIMLRGLTFQRYSTRTINFPGVRGGVILDCLFRNCGGVIIGRDSILRRCASIDDALVAFSPNSGSLVDENLVIRNWRDPLPTRTGYQSTAITYFQTELVRMRNNVVVDCPQGFWPDCMCIGLVHLGNAVAYCEGNGFYIESPIYLSSLLWNVCWRNGLGITLRANNGNTVSQNYFVGGRAGVVLSCTDWGPMQDSQIVGNWFRDMPTAIVSGPGPGGQRQTFHVADRNTFDTSVVNVAHWDSRGYKTVEEFRQGTGNEAHGRTATIDEDEIGLVWFRIAESARPWEPIPMIGNPTMQRIAWGTIGGFPYFYNIGTLDGSDLIPWPLTLSKEMNEWLQTTTGSGGALRWGRSGAYMISRNADEDKKIAARKKNPTDVGALEVTSLTGTSIWARGLGYWTVSVPTVGGARTSLRLHTMLRDVKATAPEGGLTVFAEFSDYTRTRLAREYLAGRDGAGRNQQADLMTGTRDYTPIEGVVTAPEWARRIRVFFGLRSCTGLAWFDDFDRFAVEPGQPPREQAAAAAETMPLLEPKALRFHIVDLTKILNRPLKDDRADDGQGGWTDQGAGVDMADLRPGRKEYQGVPFEIAETNSCLVLRTSCRPQSPKLPARVTIPVARKADALYFLHSAAWCGDDVEMFSYIVRYDDGTQVAIPIVGGVNITDWAAGASAKFPHPPAGQRPGIAATVGGGTLFPQVNVYLLEWLNPQPGKTIQTVDFVSADTGVPVLLGITVGTKK